MEWEKLSIEEKKTLVEKVIDEDVRPMVEMHGGGIKVISVSPNDEVSISYKGACRGCPSAQGATLSYIQDVLHSKCSSSITVVLS